MSFDLSGKLALVTGGSRGIGRRIVERFRESGAEVVFTGTNAERGTAVAAATGARFVRSDAAAADAAGEIVGALGGDGRLDVLVNNAGGLGWPQGVEETTAAAFDATLAVHLRTPWLLMAGLVPAMRRAGGGSIINIASVAAHRVGASSAAYSVAKAGLVHLTRCAAAEFGPDRIRVNSVSPGFVATSIHASAIEGGQERGERFVDSLARLFLSRQALPQTGTPGDIAEIALFLASDAAAFITGSDIIADGGLVWGRHGLF